MTPPMTCIVNLSYQIGLCSEMSWKMAYMILSSIAHTSIDTCYQMNTISYTLTSCQQVVSDQYCSRH